jgi:Uma2 family endonuclease
VTTVPPDWMVLTPEGITVADHEALPEDVCRRIEIVDGAIVVNVAPRRAHQAIARHLATALDDAVGPELAVNVAVDLRLRDVPLLNRRPDVVVHDASLPEDAVLRPEHCVLVVEVMSPGSITADRTDSPPSTRLPASRASGGSRSHRPRATRRRCSATGSTRPPVPTPPPERIPRRSP